MGALVPADSFRFEPLETIVSPPRRRLVSARNVLPCVPRAFPEAHTTRALPLLIRDEMLELYAFKFRQGGFHQLGMTFEQFLLVAAAIKPGDLVNACDDVSSLP
jgi:hypothetical protein